MSIAYILMVKTIIGQCYFIDVIKVIGGGGG